MPLLRSAPHRWKRVVGYTAAAVFLVAFGPLAGPPQTAKAEGRLARESDLKAVFVFNFAQFVEWPATSFANDRAPFVIGIIGNDPITDSLKQIVVNEAVGNRALEIRHYHDIREIDHPHILFICASETARLDRILDAVRGKSVLTVGETDEFSARDGMIRFVVAGNKLRLRINVEAAKAENLTISSKLLRQAEIVEAKQEP